ncbi:MAG: phosphoglucosamine mutase [Planctomycetota bacterium]
MSESKPQAPLMIGVSGLRGIVGESLTPEVAMRFAGAFGAWLRSRRDGPAGPASVVVGRDGREGAEWVYQATIAGLLGSGCRVTTIDVAMTPTVGVAGSHFDGGMVVTASHNPAEWNGLKCLVSETVDIDGTEDWYTVVRAPSASEAAEVIALYQTGSFVAPHELFTVPENRGTWLSSLDDSSEYHVHCVRELFRSQLPSDKMQSAREKRLFRVVVDAVNASGSKASLPFLSSIGEVVGLNCDNSGIFPHTPEPTAENLSGEGGLCDAVPGLKADVGFAQDPDGDRLAIVDETGRYIGEEYTLALCVVSILEAHQSRGREHAGTETEEIVLCANLSTSRMIDDIATRYGASVVRTAVGEANVVEAMKRLKREGKAVLLGGEGNGGVIWPEVTFVRDSLGSMALVLSLMARTGKTVSELVADIPSYAIVKRKQPLAKKEDAKPAIERIAEAYATERVDTQDGVRVDFDAKRAWVHVRASNTEPILRLIAEAEDEATANAILDKVAQLVEG